MFWRKVTDHGFHRLQCEVGRELEVAPILKYCATPNRMVPEPIHAIPRTMAAITSVQSLQIKAIKRAEMLSRNGMPTQGISDSVRSK